MYKQLRNDGFTLVEIIVSIAIGSVVLGLILSIILTSFNLFGNLSTTKLKKDSLDNIVSYVRGQILNAGTVVISEQKPSGNDWKWLYVDNDMLYRGDQAHNSGITVLDANYYNKRTNVDTSSKVNKLSIGVKVYRTNTDKNSDSSYRAKFSYTFQNSDEKYTKGDTVKFSNVKSLGDGEESSYSGDIRKIEAGKDATYTLSSTMKLYYKGTTNNSIPSPAGSYTGTIEDKIAFMTPYLNRGYFVPGTSNNDSELFSIPSNNAYRLGDFSYYQGYWWMKISNDASTSYEGPGNGAASWQKLDKNYTNGCPYQKGDVVLSEGYFYKCIVNNTKYAPPADWSANNYKGTGNTVGSPTWLCLGKENVLDKSTPGFDTSFSNLGEGDLSKIFKWQAPTTSPINDTARTSLQGYKIYANDYENVAAYDANTFKTSDYAVGSLIKVKVANSGVNGGDTNSYYQLYKKIYEPDATTTKSDLAPGGSFMSGWKLLENEYMPNSSYEAGDSVRIGTPGLNTDGNEKNYIQFLSDGKLSEDLNVSYIVNVESKDDNGNAVSKEETRKASYKLNVKALGTNSSYEYLAYKFNLMDPYMIKVNDGSIVSGDYYFTNFEGKSTKYWVKRSMIYNTTSTDPITKDVYQSGKTQSVTVDNDAMMKTYWTQKSVNELNG